MEATVIAVLIAFGLVWLVQFVFIVFVFTRLLFFKASQTADLHAVSVIVAVKNDLANIEKLIYSLSAQSHPDFEVVVVDDRSDIDIHLAMKTLVERFKNVRLIQVKDCPSHVQPKKYAITLGIKSAKHDIVVLTDADCLPKSKDWLKLMAQSFDFNTDFVLGYSGQEREKGFLNSFIRYETFQTGIQYLSLALAGMPYMGVGRNLAYRKQVFLENNGFGKFQSVVGGDDDLFVNQYAKSNKTRIAILPQSQTLTVPKKTYREFYIQKKRHLSVGKYYRFKHKVVLFLLNISQILMLPTAILASVHSPWVWIGVLGFISWSFLRHWIFFMLKKRFAESVNMSLFFIHELIFSVYLLLVGIIATTSKTVRWK